MKSLVMLQTQHLKHNIYFITCNQVKITRFWNNNINMEQTEKKELQTLNN